MYAIDTAEAIRKLTAADMPEAQARVIVDTFKHPDPEVATKADIGEIRAELKWIKWAIGVNLSFTLLIMGKLLLF